MSLFRLFLFCLVALATNRSALAASYCTEAGLTYVDDAKRIYVGRDKIKVGAPAGNVELFGSKCRVSCEWIIDEPPPSFDVACADTGAENLVGEWKLEIRAPHVIVEAAVRGGCHTYTPASLCQLSDPNAYIAVGSRGFFDGECCKQPEAPAPEPPMPPPAEPPVGDPKAPPTPPADPPADPFADQVDLCIEHYCVEGPKNKLGRDFDPDDVHLPHVYVCSELKDVAQAVIADLDEGKILGQDCRNACEMAVEECSKPYQENPEKMPHVVVEVCDKYTGSIAYYEKYCENPVEMNDDAMEMMDP